MTFTDQNRTTHTYSYDPLGRETLDSIAVYSGNPANIDTSVKALGYSYDTGGRLYQATSYSNADGTGIVNQVQYAYNGLGQETEEWQSHYGAVNTSETPSVQYGYSSIDDGSRLTSMTYPNGRVEDYVYNSGIDSAVSRVSAIADDYDYAGGDDPLDVESYTYLGADTIVQRAQGDGETLSYIGSGSSDGGDRYVGLDRFGRIINQNWENGSSVSNERFQYGYDQDGNVLYKDNLASGGSSFSELYHANSSESGDDSSAYDGLGQLQGFRRGTLTSSGYNGSTLDTVTTGNLNSIASDNSATYSLDALGNQTSSVNSRNELTGGTYAYDNNGNITEDNSCNTYAYDAWNRQIDASGGAGYSYDALGRLIGEGLDGSNREDNFYSADGHIIEEHSHYCTGATDHEILNQYVWGLGGPNDLVLRDNNNDPDIDGGEALGMADSGLDNRDYAEQDANGNVTAIVSTDGTVENHFVYDPYGAVQVLNGSYTATTSLFDNWNILYQGEKQQDNGMYLMGVRFYNPGTATWMQPEPSGASYIDGMNLYQADDSNPVTLSDPTGMAPPPTTQPSAPGVTSVDQSASMPGAAVLARDRVQWSAPAHFTGQLIQHVKVTTKATKCDDPKTPVDLSSHDKEFYESWYLNDGNFSILSKSLGKVVTEAEAAAMGNHANQDNFQPTGGDDLAGTSGSITITTVAKLVPDSTPRITAHEGASGEVPSQKTQPTGWTDEGGLKRTLVITWSYCGDVHVQWIDAVSTNPNWHRRGTYDGPLGGDVISTQPSTQPSTRPSTQP